MTGPPVAWQLFERHAAGYEAWYSTPQGRRADLAERALLERAGRRGPGLAAGIVVVALHRWSRGGWSRRWGHDARRPLLGHARDFTLGSLRALARVAAGARLRALRGASALFPAARGDRVARVPLGDVVGLAVDLGP
jgi:hypothetical protein